MERLGDGATMIYSREFVVNSDWKGKRIRLVFEAVDYEAKVIVNVRRLDLTKADMIHSVLISPIVSTSMVRKNNFQLF